MQAEHDHFTNQMSHIKTTQAPIADYKDQFPLHPLFADQDVELDFGPGDNLI